MTAPDYAQYKLEDFSCAHGGVHRCENVHEPRTRSIVFSLVFPDSVVSAFSLQTDELEKDFLRSI
jgi:hypothetical protein